MKHEIGYQEGERPPQIIQLEAALLKHRALAHTVFSWDVNGKKRYYVTEHKVDSLPESIKVSKDVKVKRNWICPGEHIPGSDPNETHDDDSKQRSRIYPGLPVTRQKRSRRKGEV